MKTVALGLAALLCAGPALADPSRFILAQPQQEVLRACEAAWGEPRFQCVTFLADANDPGAPPACVMRVPLGLEQDAPDRFAAVLAALREACAMPAAAR